MCRLNASLVRSIALAGSLAFASAASGAVRIAMPPPPPAAKPQATGRLVLVDEPAPSSNIALASSVQYSERYIGDVDVTDVGSLALARYSRDRDYPDLMYVNGRGSYYYNGPTNFYDNWGWPFWWWSFGVSCSPCGSHGSTCK